MRTHHDTKRVTFRRQLSLLVLSWVMAFATPVALTSHVGAVSYDSQMRALQAQINQYQSIANELESRANTLQAELDKLTAEKNAIQAQITLSQVEYDKLQAQIVENERKIVVRKEALGDTVANMYVSGAISPLEMLASANNISDYVDQQEYRNTVSDTLSDTINDIKRLKAKLEKDKIELKVVIDRQTSQREQLVAKEAEQAKLVEQTRGEEAAYKNLVAQNQAQLDAISAQQRSYYASLGGNSSAGVVGSFNYSGLSPSNGAGGCVGGYPYCAPQDTMVDPWGLYNRECVSYVAWALVNRFNKYVGNFSGNGNAGDWTWSAPRYSGAYRVSDPQPGDAVILPASANFAPVGHAMIVESVSGGNVFVSQFNFYGTGQYSTMNIAKSGVVFLRFQNR